MTFPALRWWLWLVPQRGASVSTPGPGIKSIVILQVGSASFLTTDGNDRLRVG